MDDDDSLPDAGGRSSLEDVRRMIVGLLEWLHLVAVEPGRARTVEREPLKRLHLVREVLSMGAIAREPPRPSSPGRERKRKSPDVSPQGDEPLRKSKRIEVPVMDLLSSSPQEDVGIGPSFQADVPEWTGPPGEEDMVTLKYLGTPLPDPADQREDRDK